MDRQTLLALYDQQLRQALELPGTRKEVTPHITRFVRPAPGANTILYSRLDETNADAVIAEQIAYFAPMGQPFDWRVCEHDSPRDLRQRLVAHGFEADEPDAVMVLEIEHAPPALLAPVTADVRPITQRAALEDVVQVQEAVWGANFEWIFQRLGDHLEIPDYLNVYVAYVDGLPASAAWIYFHPNSDFASLFAGSTRAEHRKRGLYTALLATRVQAARARGYRFLTVDAGEMSLPIVTHHGFQLLTLRHDCGWPYPQPS